MTATLEDRPATAQEDHEHGGSPGFRELAEADVVDLAVGVVSPSNATNDPTVKPLDYAEWGIPLFLLVDPRAGTVRLHWNPDGQRYRAHQDIAFGGTLALHEPLKGVEIDTSDFPRYEKRRGQ